MVKAVKIGTEVVGGDIGGEEAVEGQRSEARNVSTIEIRIERTD
jgi:DNA-binding protein